MQSTDSDAALLAKAHAGDARAVEALLEKHQNQVYRYGLRMCGNEADARDVLQETLIAAYRNLGSFRGDARLSTWLYQIARSFCLKQRRRREGEPAQHDSLDDAEARGQASDSSASDARAHARQVSEVIQAAIGTLPEEHREALVLRDVEGLSAEEAASVVGIEVGALKSRLHRARMALKERLAAVIDTNEQAIECPELASELSAYAASEIDQAACERIEAHLAKCQRCSAACESLKRTVSMCRAIPGGEVPVPVKAAVRAALRRAGLDVHP
ncbi:MAG: sigma-70 family RNA polymerase sigma factor [Myxococcaceae bacterium]|jgi:RNA polymerase sigma-70 factor (ECF subfamily)|nr:sigma-70 family RNA polymerase sigma factor [Myxococcaceae bacterium]